MPHSILSIYVMPFKVIRHCWKYKFVSAYILNFLCVFYISKIRHEYFVVYREYADGHNTEPISANFRPKKNKIPNHLSIHYRMGKKINSRYCSFDYVNRDRIVKKLHLQYTTNVISAVISRSNQN